MLEKLQTKRINPWEKKYGQVPSVSLTTHSHGVPVHFLVVTMHLLFDASSVTSENIVPSGRVLALGKCATVLEGPSATSSC